MNNKTLKALEKSICKHSMIAYGMKGDRGGHDCALCQLFTDTCIKCPVGQCTGQQQCGGSPWRDRLQIGFDITVPIPKLRALSNVDIDDIWKSIELEEQEVIFLCSLLPKDHKWYEELGCYRYAYCLGGWR